MFGPGTRPTSQAPQTIAIKTITALTIRNLLLRIFFGL